MSARIRLTAITSHLRPSQRLKIVVSRNVGTEAMGMLLERPELDVSALIVDTVPEILTRSKVIVWPEEAVCDRKWLLENISGANGVLVMLSEKVRYVIFEPISAVSQCFAHRWMSKHWMPVRVSALCSTERC